MQSQAEADFMGGAACSDTIQLNICSLKKHPLTEVPSYYLLN